MDYLPVLTLMCIMTTAWCRPTIYQVDEAERSARPLIVPVASTVIPLDELPVFKVGLGFGLTTHLGNDAHEAQLKKPDNLKEIQLITAKNQHRFVAAAGVQELSKEEFEQFHLSEK